MIFLVLSIQSETFPAPCFHATGLVLEFRRPRAADGTMLKTV